MAISNNTPRVTIEATAGQTVFNWTFRVFTSAGLAVFVDDVEQTITTDYTITDLGDDDGGTLTFVSGLSAGDIVVIERQVSRARTSDYTQLGAFSANLIDNDLDRIWAALQEDVLRNLQTAVGTTNYDAEGNRIINMADPIASTDGATRKWVTEVGLQNHQHSASDTTSGTFADARISQSSVTQHQAAIDHNALTNYVALQHLDWTADQGSSNIHDDNIAQSSVTQHASAVGAQLTGTFQGLDATLTALAGVTTAADKVIYATGSDTFATTDLTSFARTLLDDANAATARATLGISASTTGLAAIEDDPAPTLGANLETNEFTIGNATGSNTIQFFDNGNVGLVAGANLAEVATGDYALLAGGAAGIVAAGAIGISSTGSSVSMSASTDVTLTAGGDIVFAATGDVTGTSWEKIASGSESASSSLDFTGLSADHAQYRLAFNNLVPGTNNRHFYCLLSTDNGSNYLASNYRWNLAHFFGAHGTTSVSGQAQIILVFDCGSAGNETVDGEFLIINPMANNITTVRSNYAQLDQFPLYGQGFSSGRHDTAAQHNAVRFLFATGNIASMNWTLYGLRA